MIDRYVLHDVITGEFFSSSGIRVANINDAKIFNSIYAALEYPNYNDHTQVIEVEIVPKEITVKANIECEED